MNYIAHFFCPTLSVIIVAGHWPIYFVFCPNTSAANIAPYGSPHMSLKWFRACYGVIPIRHIVPVTPTVVVISELFSGVAFVVWVVGPCWELMHLCIVSTVVSTASIATLSHLNLVPTPCLPPASPASSLILGTLVLLHLWLLLECWCVVEWLLLELATRWLLLHHCRLIHHWRLLSNFLSCIIVH